MYSIRKYLLLEYPLMKKITVLKNKNFNYKQSKYQIITMQYNLYFADYAIKCYAPRNQYYPILLWILNVEKYN